MNGLDFVLIEYTGETKTIRNSNKLKDLVLQNYETEWKNFDAIIGEPMSISGTKVIKIIKYGKLAILRNPKAIFSRSGQTISLGSLICFMVQEILIKQ